MTETTGAAVDFVPAGSGSGGGEPPASQPGGEGGRGRGGSDRGRIGRIVLFYRQVIAELRKVIWPTRNELITYTTVVLIFVAAMIAIVAGFDFVFTKGVLAVFS